MHVFLVNNYKMSASFLTEESEKDIQLVEIDVEYSYYGSTRTTPVFLAKEQLCSMNYDTFTTFITSEIPHLRRRTSVPLRYCLMQIMRSIFRGSIVLINCLNLLVVEFKLLA